MALKKTITASGEVSILDNGISLKTEASTKSEAYIKVDRVDSSKSSAIVYVSYTGDKIIGNKTFDFTPNLDSEYNFIKQAYLHLKSLPEFADAVDC